MYEFTFLTADGDKKLLTSTEDIIKQFSGKVTQKDEWGKRDLAYRIGSLTEAHYHLWTIEIEPSQIKDLKNRLNIENGIVRYLIVKK